ncbi:MAG: hypothetical protein WD875_18820 [Pirellulales bacterium]
MSHNRCLWHALLGVIVVWTFSPVEANADALAPRHQLAIRDSQFTLDGKPVFLLGCSYYGALGASAEVWQKDLDDMQKAGINWIRVWATWAAFGNDVSAVDGDGAPRQPYLDKLQKLVDECDRRGMIVDVTLSRGNGVTGPSRLAKLDTHRRAVETLVEALKSRRNWYLDLANERNIQDERFVSFDDLKALRDRVRELESDLLVTASQGGDLSDADLRKYIVKVGVDFVAPHRPRDHDSPAHTDEVTRKLLKSMKAMGHVVPVHFQEPLRRAYSSSFDAKDFEADLRGAISGGAAGWCFHNGDARNAKDGRPRRSFDLTSQRLFEQLDDVELTAIRGFQEVLRASGRKAEK